MALVDIFHHAISLRLTIYPLNCTCVDGVPNSFLYLIDILHLPVSFKKPFTYLLTPWSRVLLEKLTGLQLVKKFPAFYGTRRFLTALTSARHVSLS
jgi:hypothetical protein